jgi:hypothetical protein
MFSPPSSVKCACVLVCGNVTSMHTFKYHVYVYLCVFVCVQEGVRVNVCKGEGGQCLPITFCFVSR